MAGHYRINLTMRQLAPLVGISAGLRVAAALGAAVVLPAALAAATSTAPRPNGAGVTWPRS